MKREGESVGGYGVVGAFDDGGFFFLSSLIYFIFSFFLALSVLLSIFYFLSAWSIGRHYSVTLASSVTVHEKGRYA